MIRVLVVLLVWFAAPGLRAHTTELLGGRLSLRADGALALSLEVSAKRLPIFVGSKAESFATWGDVRAQADALVACFQDSLVVFVDGRDVAATEVELPDLAGAARADALPEFVQVVVVWRGLPHPARTVIPRFDLSEANVFLVLDDSFGDAVASSATGSAENTPIGSSWERIGRALVVGYEHIVPHGLDHILFVLGLFFAARCFRDLLWQVTMFTVAHSITLGLAMAGVVVLSDAWATAVEIGIAVSIVAVALENCFVRQAPGWRRLAVVGAFGLIHGLGFAGALSEVNWPTDQFAVALLAANLGIELGQLTVVGAAALLTAWAWRRAWFRGGVSVPASIAVGAWGLYWAVERTMSALGG